MKKLKILVAAQFSEFMTTGKNIAILLLGAALAVYYSDQYIKYSIFLSKAINPFESYVIIGSSRVQFTCCILLCLMLLTFETPYFTERSMIELVRVGKKEWMSAKIVFLFSQILLFSIYILAVTALFTIVSTSHLSWGKWSEAMQSLVGIGQGVALNRFQLSFDYPMFLESVSLRQAVFLTLFFNCGYCLILALVMMVFNITLGETKGWILAAGIHILGYVISNNGHGVFFKFSFSLLNCALPANQFTAVSGTNLLNSGIVLVCMICILLLPTKWLRKRLVL